MRSATIISALFAAGAFAQPLEHKRDVIVETQVSVVYTTLVVDSNGQAVPAATPAPAPAAVPAPVPAPVAPAPSAPTSPVWLPHKDRIHHQTQPDPAPAPAPAPSAPTSPAWLPHKDRIHHDTQPVPAPAPAPAAPVPAPHAHIADSYASAGVQIHNLHRRNHAAPPMAWDGALAASAAALAATCDFHHDVTLGPASNYGQNIASSSPASGSEANELQQVVGQLWYAGEVNNFSGLYGQDYPDMTNFDSWGHYTQVVWKDSTRVGCHTQNCPDMGYFTVCNYGPAGNMVGEFAQNVSPPS